MSIHIKIPLLKAVILMTAKTIVRSIFTLREMGLSDTQIIEFILRIGDDEMKNPSESLPE